MPEQLKNIYTPEKITAIADAVKKENKRFDKESFITSVFDETWQSRELKDRMHHIADSLYNCLNGDYEQRIEILLGVAPRFRGFEYMLFPDIVERHGLEYEEISLKALKEFTKTSSSEFAIRPFIIRNPEKVMSVLNEWSKDEHFAIRRCASEGCRPRLPWAMALPQFQKNPEPILPILERLKNDDTDYVRRSVANNLNDISKDHPDKVLEIIGRWKGNSEYTDWICKHASRTLLKKSNPKALALHGFTGKSEDLDIREFSLEKSTVYIGGENRFSCTVLSSSTKKRKVRIEYAIDYVKKNGKTSRKVFVLTEREFEPNSEYRINRNIPLHDMTTRKHYAGVHIITLLLNGQAMAHGEFELM